MNILDKVITRKTFSLCSEGVSMLPILHPGDIITYNKIRFPQCKTNDVILIKQNKKLFAHRVIYKARNYLITKGDNNLQADKRVYPHQIIAKVIQVKRNGKLFNPNDIYLYQSTFYFQEIVKIKKELERKKIDFVFLKGLPLHLHFGEEHPHRIYADCDVLVNKKETLQVRQIFLKNGYKELSQSLSKTHDTLRRKTVEISYSKLLHGFNVIFDIHFEIDWMSPQLGRLDAFYPQNLLDQLTNEFLTSKKTVTIQGSTFHLLPSTLQIVYLALHFFHHNFNGVFRLELLDKIVRSCHLERGERSRPIGRTRFARFLSRSSFEMTGCGQIAQIVTNYRLQNFVYPVFLLLKKYYKTPIPVSFFKSIQPINSLILKLVNSLTKTNIFNDEPRITAGIRRFQNLFWLSPEPLWRKLFVFVNPQVVYTIIWLVVRRLKGLRVIKLKKLEDLKF